MDPLNVDIDACDHRAVIGTGGIGTGMFFALEGSHTLGREESRSGYFINRRDYCKLHIVSHYVKAMLGPGFCTIPIGLVGDDEAGKTLLREMEEAGLDMTYVTSLKGAQTLFSFCFIYPDGSGGNLTTSDSASGRVSPDYVEGARGAFARYRGRGIALAVPEVPLDARARLLELGTAHSFFRVASFTTGELEEVVEAGTLGSVDLLALNLEEAARIASLLEGKTGRDDLFPRRQRNGCRDEEVVRKAIESLVNLHHSLLVTITAGKGGSWAWDGRHLTHVPVVETEVVSTAGAGDAFLAGIIAGLAAGLPLFEAQELSSLVAALSVTSPHTIHRGINRSLLKNFYLEKGVTLSERVRMLIEDACHGDSVTG